MERRIPAELIRLCSPRIRLGGVQSGRERPRAMASKSSEQESVARGTAQFATTHWSVVLAAGDSASPDSQEALESLCRQYWVPLYAFVRRSGREAEEAKDLTQAFFARLLERRILGQADQDRGRFRTFLLACLKNFLRDQWDKEKAQKRGGGVRQVSFVRPEDPGLIPEWEGTASETPEHVYERHWARVLLERVMMRLERESTNHDLFLALKAHVSQEEGSTPYADLAAHWQTTEGALRMKVHRMRDRYREMLREEIAQTVHEAEEIDDEIRHLVSVFSEA